MNTAEVIAWEIVRWYMAECRKRSDSEELSSKKTDELYQNKTFFVNVVGPHLLTRTTQRNRKKVVSWLRHFFVFFDQSVFVSLTGNRA